MIDCSINTFSICAEGKEKLYNDLSLFLKLALEQDNVCVVTKEDDNIISVQYEHDEGSDAWGCDNPYWISEEEWELVQDFRKNKSKE